MQFPITQPSASAIQMNYNNLDDFIVWEKQQTDIPGLTFRPYITSVKDDATMTSQCLNNRDGMFCSRSLSPYDPYLNCYREFSQLDQDVLTKYLKELVLTVSNDTPLVIVEIGVDRQSICIDPVWKVSKLTSTIVLLENKRPQDIYIGIDIDDKSYLHNAEHNIFTIQSDSANHSYIRSQFKKLGIEKIDFLFIDGWHSVNQVIEEWKFTDMLSSNGVVAMHDTNGHPGPYLLMEAIDTNMYDVKKYLSDVVDYGMGIAKRKITQQAPI